MWKRNCCGKRKACRRYASGRKRWGYPSEKDNEDHSFDLCEQCYDEFTATFLIPIEQR